jgi:hypothetical protein
MVGISRLRSRSGSDNRRTPAIVASVTWPKVQLAEALQKTPEGKTPLRLNLSLYFEALRQLLFPQYVHRVYMGRSQCRHQGSKRSHDEHQNNSGR